MSQTITRREKKRAIKDAAKQIRVDADHAWDQKKLAYREEDYSAVRKHSDEATRLYQLASILAHDVRVV